MSNRRMPALFVGHGSPMNAVEDNEFSCAWAAAAQALPRPKAVLCISAHWETEGVRVTAAARPRTIHDFYGFPKELYDIRYPAPGSTELVEAVRAALRATDVGTDEQWGLDHGTWSVLRRMYPGADVPCVQLSLDTTRSLRSHYELGGALAALRDQGVLLLGSGNIVHNLQMADFGVAGGFDWAVEFDRKTEELISAGDYEPLIDFRRLGEAALLSVNSGEHYKPLLYVLGMRDRDEPVGYFATGMVAGSLSMRSVRIG